MIHVRDTAVLIVDRKHRGYGHLGALDSYDRLGNGSISVRYTNGNLESFSEDEHGTQINSRVKIFYRQFNDEGRKYDLQGMGPISLLREFLLCGGTLGDFVPEYLALFGEHLRGTRVEFRTVRPSKGATIIPLRR